MNREVFSKWYYEQEQIKMKNEATQRGRPPMGGETATGWIQARTTISRKNAYVLAARARKMKLTAWIFEACDKAAGYVAG